MMSHEQDTDRTEDENKESLTPEQVREKIESALMPCEGPGIYERGMAGEDGYGACAESLARALLITVEDCREENGIDLLDVSEEEKDESGWEAANNDKLWMATQARFPGLAQWLGGPTGFQYGWAHNAVRYALGADTVGNPAIATVGKTDE